MTIAALPELALLDENAQETGKTLAFGQVRGPYWFAQIEGADGEAVSATHFRLDSIIGFASMEPGEKRPFGDWWIELDEPLYRLSVWTAAGSARSLFLRASELRGFAARLAG